jgi:hypothetical protein
MRKPHSTSLITTITAAVTLTLLVGCASDNYYSRGRDTEEWIKGTIYPILASDPARAASMIHSKMKSTCLMDVKLGGNSFRAKFANTDRYVNYESCTKLNGTLVIAYWKAKNYTEIPPHLSQVIQDVFPIIMNKGWSTYGETQCQAHKQWRHFISPFPAPEIPPWYEVHAKASPAAASQANFLYKRYLCMLDSSRLDSQEGVKNTFKRDVQRLFGNAAASDVERYYQEIFIPMEFALRSIPYTSGQDLAHYVKIETLYKNGLTHLHKIGLDKTKYNGEAVFVTHLRSRIDNNANSLKIFSK